MEEDAESETLAGGDAVDEDAESEALADVAAVGEDAVEEDVAIVPLDVGEDQCLVWHVNEGGV